MGHAARVRRQPAEANGCKERAGGLELCGGPYLVCTKASKGGLRRGGCARANGHAAATRRLGVTSGTGATTGALITGDAKEPAAEDE
jgi:hypothetical protein